MTCGETREYLFAFLDSELDSALSIEVQLHLDTCPDCAREAEIERAVRKSLEAAVDVELGSVPAFDDAVGDTVRDTICDAAGGTIGGTTGEAAAMPPRDADAAALTSASLTGEAVTRERPAGGTGRMFKMGRIAAVFGVVVGLGLLGRFWTLVGSDDRRIASVSDLVAADFGHFLAEGKSVQLASADVETVTGWLREKTSLDVTLPISRDPKCKLLGGRKCKLEGRTAAFALYEMHGSLASLVAVAADSVNMDGMKALSHAGRVHWVDERDGFTVVANRRNDVVYAVVSRLPKEDLYCLMTDSTHESH